MTLEPPYFIDSRKLTSYLLVHAPKNDKSNYLRMAGYALENWVILEKDLMILVETQDAIIENHSVFGDSFSVTGSLIGPNGRLLLVKTIWMKEKKADFTKFITLFPLR